MRVVLDTNVLLVSIPVKSRFRPIFEAYLSGKIEVVVSTAIFLEYKEILDSHGRPGIGDYVKDSMLSADNVFFTDIYYNWNLITTDHDDNKFIDAYIASNAHYLVTNDKHFNEVKGYEFPPITIISAEHFLDIISTL